MNVTFVYPNSRTALLERIAADEAPDTSLLGQNHLRDYAIDATIHSPLLRRVDRVAGLRHRITWNVRELTLAWELRDADLVCTPLARIFPLMARLQRRPPVLLISYHLCAIYDRSSPARRRLMRASIGSAAAVVCNAAAGRERLIAQTQVEPEKVHVACLGVDERFWTPAPPAEDGYVLTVGRDLARDYGTFARAMDGLPARAIVVAKEENLRGVDLPSNVEVRLDVSPLEVRELYAGAACVVVPIRSEGYRFGSENSGTVALLEAMATARPAIVSERSTLRDYVRPEETALTVPPEDAASLRATVERVLGEPALAASLGSNGRRAVEEGYTTRAFAGRLAGVIERLPL